MHMFENFLSSIPKNRSDMVNDLEIPDVTLSPYIWEPEDSIARSESTLTTSTEEQDLGTISTDSSIPLSRAMTDSDIDYGRFRRYKNRCFSDPWKEMRTALDAFPSGHLDSLSSFQESSPLIEPDLPRTKPGSTRDSIRRYNRELGRKMERYFDEECLVFHPDDPGLEKIIDSEWDSITP